MPVPQSAHEHGCPRAPTTDVPRHAIMIDEPLLLDIRGLSKQLGGTRALNDVAFDVRKGEIHALLGGNGAGKSTLIKTLAGVHRPDAGTIALDGTVIDTSVDQPAISFIHQDLGLIDAMTIAENIGLVRGYPRRSGVIDWRALNDKARHALGLVGSTLDPQITVSQLRATDKSMVAIARALAGNARLLVLDEPTASLPEADVARLFDVLARLRERGVGMIYVSHRLDEVFRIADRVTVLRDGKKVATVALADTTPGELVLMIVGRPPADVFVKPLHPEAQAVLDVRDLRVADAGPVSLTVRAGEMVGLTGLRGAGQDEVGRAIAGILPILGGTIHLHGREIHPVSPSAAIRLGIGFVSSKRQEESLAVALCVQENLYLNPAAYGRRLGSAQSWQRERSSAAAVIERYDVRPRDPERVVSTLSGGNQQKVVVARTVAIGQALLVLEEPTQGVDVGAKADIYATLAMALTRETGLGVILVSSDLEEIAGVCNRALIFRYGKIVDEVCGSDMTLRSLTSLVTGAGRMA
jgi:ribose transport system ATP-binding protein